MITAVKTGWWTLMIGTAILLSGCPDAIRTSVNSLDFGDSGTILRLDVWNGDPDLKEMKLNLSSDADWLTIDPVELVSRAPMASDTEGTTGEDKVNVIVKADRTKLRGDAKEARLVLDGPRVKRKTISVFISPPYDAIGVSTDAVTFGPRENTATLELWKSNTTFRDPILITASTSAPWLKVKGGLLGAFLSYGASDRITVVLELDRGKMSGGVNTATVTFNTPNFRSVSVAVTATQTYDAINVSNTSLDFGLDTRPWELDVWNQSTRFPSLNIRLSSDQDWISIQPAEVTSAAPVLGITDKRRVTVYIDRSRLAEGIHTGEILVTSDRDDVTEVRISVRVEQRADAAGSGLKIENVAARYTDPYLVEFAFALRDAYGRPVVADPGQVEARAFENGVETIDPPILRRASARQMRVEMVMDYSLYMHNAQGAVESMESAARDLLLPAIPPEAMLGITAFWREDTTYKEGTRIMPFSTDRDLAAARIDQIDPDQTEGFYAGALALDVLYKAIGQFNTADASAEERFIVFFSSGYIDPGQRTVNDVVNLARQRRVRVYALAFLENARDITTLNDITTRTYGQRLDARQPELLATAFAQLADNLQGQYVLRWPTLRRNATPFSPAFRLTRGDATALYYAADQYVPSSYSGTVTEGKLRLVTSAVVDQAATAVIHADYIPRNIRQIRLVVRTPFPHAVSLVETADDGIAGNWTISLSEEDGKTIIDLASPDTTLPFATWGPILRIHFSDVVLNETTPLIEELYCDNSIYTTGQTLVFSNFQ